MFLDAMKIRIGMILVGLVMMGVYVAYGGRFGPGDRGVIQIEYGAYPEMFAGLTVEIDGKPAGVLKSFGRSTRTVFSVKEGEHTVRVLHPNLLSEPRLVDARTTLPVLLILDEHMAVDEHGATRQAIAFQ
jgi:hypothetical protein